MIWGFEGDRYQAISIETRKEPGEQYGALRGFVRQIDELKGCAQNCEGSCQ